MNSKIFEFTLQVNEEHIDERKHVNNLVYMLWCLQAAEGHWKQATTAAQRQQFMWYVLRHEIDYKAAAFMSDQLSVKTWVAKTRGARCERHYEIAKLPEGQLLVSAKTIWCLISRDTERPCLIPEEIRNLFIDEQTH